MQTNLSDSELERSSPAPVRTRPIAWVTWLLVSSTVTVFLMQLHAQSLHGADTLGDRLAFSAQAWAEGRSWTLITYAWAHAVAMFGEPDLFWLHIVANMIPLVFLGPLLEDFLGHVAYLGLYLGGAIASALVWFWFNPQSDEGIIGASGAVFALIAGVGTAVPREPVVVYLFFVLPIKMSLLVLALLIIGVELAQMVMGWMPDVAHTAHLGGAAFGFVYVLIVRVLTRRKAYESAL
jgi:membrane associated rhomboid family serine protease